MIGITPRQTFSIALRDGVTFPCRFMTQDQVRERRLLNREAESLERDGSIEEADEKFKAAMAIAFGDQADAVIREMGALTPFQAIEFIDSIDHKQFMAEADKKKSASQSASVSASSASPDATASATPATTPTA